MTNTNICWTKSLIKNRIAAKSSRRWITKSIPLHRLILACIYFYFVRGSGCEVLWWVCTSVCLFVCLSAKISPEPHPRSLPIFVHVACVRSSVLLRHVYDRPHRLSPGRGFPHWKYIIGQEMGVRSADKVCCLYDCLVINWTVISSDANLPTFPNNALVDRLKDRFAWVTEHFSCCPAVNTVSHRRRETMAICSRRETTVFLKSCVYIRPQSALTAADE